AAVAVGEARDRVVREQGGVVGPRAQLDLGADGHRGRLLLAELADPELARRVADPFDRGHLAGRAAAHDDRVAHHEAAEQTDAELAEVAGAALLQDVVALRAAADGRQQVGGLIGREPDAVVAEAEGPVDRGDDVDGSGRSPGVEVAAGPDRVATVLQQLAEEDVGARVDVAPEQVDDSAEIDLERAGVRETHLIRLFLSPTPDHGCSTAVYATISRMSSPSR